MIHLDVSNYTGVFAPLNTEKSLKVSRLSLARAMVTVGRHSWHDTYQIGMYRIGELLCKALGFTTVNGRCVVLNDRFFKLSQSEKGSTSYYFGQAFTKLYTEEKLGVKWLLHLDDYSSMLTILPSGTATPKIVIDPSVTTGSRPDLLGIVKTNTSHILEAKGYSKYYFRNVMQKALNQVSHVTHYNGNPPETRTACYFKLCETTTKGIIIDPENQNSGINIDFDEVAALNRFYSFFREHQEFFSSLFVVQGVKYRSLPVGVPNIFFGFNEAILEKPTAEILESGFGTTENNRDRNNSEFGYSIGLDGLIVLDNEVFSRHQDNPR